MTVMCEGAELQLVGDDEKAEHQREMWRKSYHEKKKYKPEYIEKREERARKSHLRTTYDMSVEEYDRMAAEQKHVCAICETKPEKKLEVDHNHTTGAVRGLLCGFCNKLLSNACEKLRTLFMAMLYLKKFNNISDAVFDALLEEFGYVRTRPF